MRKNVYSESEDDRNADTDAVSNECNDISFLLESTTTYVVNKNVHKNHNNFNWIWYISIFWTYKKIKKIICLRLLKADYF